MWAKGRRIKLTAISCITRINVVTSFPVTINKIVRITTHYKTITHAEAYMMLEHTSTVRFNSVE